MSLPPHLASDGLLNASVERGGHGGGGAGGGGGGHVVGSMPDSRHHYAMHSRYAYDLEPDAPLGDPNLSYMSMPNPDGLGGGLGVPGMHLGLSSPSTAGLGLGSEGEVLADMGLLSASAAGSGMMTSPSSIGHHGTSASVSSADTHPPVKGPSKHPRLLSLDAFRGLVIAWMIMSDEGGPAWTHWIDHAPWNGIHFADFVFPAFLFIVGMAIPLSTHKFYSQGKRWQATKKAGWRTLKLFLVGFLAASGGFPFAHVKDDEDSDQLMPVKFFRLASIRIPGILQRIAFCYFITVLVHVWIPVRGEDEDGSGSGSGNGLYYSSGGAQSTWKRLLEFHRKYLWQWCVALAFLVLYWGLMYGTPVPGCGRGHMDPECNAAGYWDRTILSLDHLYTKPTLTRTPECSTNSPGDHPKIPRPAWCDRPFDPEGIVSTFPAVVTTIVGLMFGHVLSFETGPTPSEAHRNRIAQWMFLAVWGFLIGIILHVTGAIPWNKNLWSPSYVAFNIGVDATVFSLFYFIVDIRRRSKVFLPLISMGSNAILVFVLAQTEISVDNFMQWFYLSTPDQNLYIFYQRHILNAIMNTDWTIFIWACTKVIAWFIISVILYKRKIFWKI